MYFIFFIYFDILLGKIRLAMQMIHMKYQVLFSLKPKMKMSSAIIMISALRV